MTPKQMLAMVRKLIADEQATGFTEGGNLEEPEGTQELQNYLNRAVDEYSKRQAGQKDIRLMKRLTIQAGDKLPLDFLTWCGCVPVNIEGGKISFYGEADAMPVKYMARLPYVTEYDDESELPYETDQSTAITALAAIYALNKHEYNVSQHLMLMGYGTSGDGSK